MAGKITLLDSITNILIHLDNIPRDGESIYRKPQEFLKLIKEKNRYRQEEMLKFRQLYFDSMIQEIFDTSPEMARDIFNELVTRYKNNPSSIEVAKDNLTKDYKRYSNLMQLPQLLEYANFITTLDPKKIDKDNLFLLACSTYILTHNWMAYGIKNCCNKSYEKYIYKKKLHSLRNAIVHTVDNDFIRKVDDGLYYVKYKWKKEQEIDELFDFKKVFEWLDQLTFFGIICFRSLAYFRIDSIIHKEILDNGGMTIDRVEVKIN